MICGMFVQSEKFVEAHDGTIGHTFHHDAHPDFKADYVQASPPFNDSDWRGELLKGDKRGVYGAPPAGIAGFVLANGSMSANQSGEGKIRKNLKHLGFEYSR